MPPPTRSASRLPHAPTDSSAPSPTPLPSPTPPPSPAACVSPLLVEASASDCTAVLAKLGTSSDGLSTVEVARRLVEYGPNVAAQDARFPRLRLMRKALVNPLVILLVVLSASSFATDDARAGVVILLMVVIGVAVRFVQEARADSVAASLRSMITVSATLMRGGVAVEVPLAEVVPGDMVRLAAGDMNPADVRLLSCKDLFLMEGSLTGESFPVEKFAAREDGQGRSALELTNICYLGTSVESGSATAVVVATGLATFLGGVSASLVEAQGPTSFDRGVARFTWLMIGFIAVLAPLVFVINGVTKGDWLLRDGRRRRPHARDDAYDRRGLPVEARAGDVPPESHRQAADRHPEPRRDGSALHRQDRDAHARPRRGREVLRRSLGAGRRSARTRVPEQPLPDRG